MIARRPLLAALAVVSCRKPAPPVARDAAPAPRAVVDAPRDVSVDHAAAVEAPRVLPRFTPPPGPPRPDAGLRRPTTAARAAPANADDPWALVASPRGALWVRAVNRPGQRVSEIVATVLGRDGVAVGEPKLLRRTTGPVRAVSADAVGADVWVAWHAVRPDATATREEHIVAALHGDAELREVGAPVTVADFSYAPQPDAPYTWSEATARVFVRDDGGALLVSTGARAVCVHGEEDHAERVPCEGWNVSRVDLDGRKRVEGMSLLCPVGTPRAFVRVPGGVAYMVQDDHIGTKLVAFTAAFGDAAVTDVPSDFGIWHYGAPSMAWGDGVFALQGTYTEASDEGREREVGVTLRGPTPATRTPMLRDRYNSELMPALRRAPLRCVDGHPVVRVAWARGPAAGVTFDPTRPGTSIDLADWADLRTLPLPAGAEGPPSVLVWAGEALVGVVGTSLARWTCGPHGALRLALGFGVRLGAGRIEARRLFRASPVARIWPLAARWWRLSRLGALGHRPYAR